MPAKITKSILVTALFLFFGSEVFAQKPKQMVRMALLEIDSLQIDQYKSALVEEIKASMKKEKGVKTLYAVAEKDKPYNIRILEIYASPEAYQKHLKTPHFLKYKSTTSSMVKHLQLIEVDPLIDDLKIK